LQLFTRLSLALPSFALSLSRYISLAIIVSLSHASLISGYYRYLSFSHASSRTISFFRKHSHLAILFSPSRANCKSRAIIVLSRRRCLALSFCLFRARSLRAIVLSLSYAVSSRYRSFFRTRCSRTRYLALWFSLSLSIAHGRYHSLTFASSFFHLCVILQCVVLFPR